MSRRRVSTIYCRWCGILSLRSKATDVTSREVRYAPNINHISGLLECGHRKTWVVAK